MRPYILVPMAIIVPIAASLGIRALTEDMLSAVSLALVLIVTVLAWFSGKDEASRRAGARH